MCSNNVANLHLCLPDWVQLVYRLGARLFLLLSFCFCLSSAWTPRQHSSVAYGVRVTAVAVQVSQLCFSYP